MSEESHKRNPPRKPRSSQLAAELKSEVHDLMSTLLDERITEAQRQRLEKLGVADEGVAELCLAVMHLSCSLPLHVLLDELATGGSDGEGQTSVASLMHETLIVPGIREADVSRYEADPDYAENRSLPFAPKKSKKRPATWVWASAAGLLLASTVAIWIFLIRSRDGNVTQMARQVSAQTSGEKSRPAIGQKLADSRPSAEISATAAVDANDAGVIFPGAKLSPGHQVRLAGGAVELTFVGGAIAVIRGPARFEVVDPNTLALHAGSMTAHVPFAARGFRINSPGLSVIDRGTDFGVRTVPNTAASEAHVFGGSVDVLALNSAGQSIASPVRLVASQACRHDSGDAGAPVSVPFAPQGFSRDIASIRQPLNLHGTGGGLKPGAPDPYWQLVSSPEELNWKPQQAAVISDTGYPDSQNIPDAKWISTDNERKSGPTGRSVFRTTVDLTGFDPATVSVEARVTADDWVSDIRVNDVSTGLSTELAESHDRFVPSMLRIPDTCWRSGVNRVDVVVHNKAMAGGGLNAMGLQLGWSASGCPVVKR